MSGVYTRRKSGGFAALPMGGPVLSILAQSSSYEESLRRLHHTARDVATESNSHGL